MQRRARLLFLLALIPTLAGCPADERLPPAPPGTGGGTGAMGTIDASDGSGGDGGTLATGRVCRLVDMRSPTSCAQLADMSGIPVAEQGGAPVLTAVDGSFALPAIRPDQLVIEAARATAGYQQSVVPVLRSGQPDGIVVPVADSSAWQSLVRTLDLVVPDGTGVIAVYLHEQGVPAPDYLVTNVSAAGGVIYNAGGPLDWLFDSLTGPTGAALVLGVSAPTAELTITDVEGTRFLVIGDIPVSLDAITFINIDSSQ